MTISIANAPCSWGVLEFDEVGSEPLDARRFLQELVTAGYAGTELGDWGFLPTEPDALRELLDEYGVPVLGAFVPVDLSNAQAHDSGANVAVRTANLMKRHYPNAYVVLSDDNCRDMTRTARAGRIRPQDGLSPSEWDVVAAGATLVAERVRAETGLRTVLHHHCGGWIETPDEVAQLFARVDDDVLGLCLDTGHWTFAGGDPVAALATYGDRIWHVHFKDCEPTVSERSRAHDWDYFTSIRHGVFCELGKGSVNFEAVVDHLVERDYRGWIVVEQDVLPSMGAPLESAARNRTFLKQLGL